ncbi:MAG TPA: peptide chain release factor 1 [Hadesarchaea archaeon]|nr:peptide chain release factor 1 [Hadesarchaea archaeon]
MTMDSKARYRFRRMLDDLEDKRGRGTELISVYISPDTDLAKVIQQLRDEQGTASNIKSKSTRKNVTAALERIIQFLRTYSETNRKPPSHGMAIFCGNVAGREDIADIKLYWIEPPEPITIRMYRCDQEFVLEPLREMLQVKETVGLLVMDRREATLATLRGKNVNIVRKLTSAVPGKHSKGGQSARRFERLREIAAHEYAKRVAEAANEIFSQVSSLKAIVVGGPGPTKEDFLNSGLLYESVKRKVAGVLDTGYTDEQGIKELVSKAGDVLADLEILKEKSLMQRFMEELVAGGGLATYGEREIRHALEQGAVELLLVSEGLRKNRATIRCQNCGHEFQETVENLGSYQRQLTTRDCPKCSEEKLSVTEIQDEVQELLDRAEKFNTKVEFISTETEEGKQLQAAFKGLAAILRFKAIT